MDVAQKPIGEMADMRVGDILSVLEKWYVRKSDSSHSGNVSFTGGGKVSVSVTSIISSDVVQRQVESVKEIAAISSATKSK